LLLAFPYVIFVDSVQLSHGRQRPTSSTTAQQHGILWRDNNNLIC